MKDTAGAMRVVEAGGRSATVLETASTRVVIDDAGGMTPEFSAVQDKRAVNVHWIPHFRSNAGEAYDDKKHGGYWKDPVLYNIAGSFPCLPNFGDAHILAGDTMPSHGWTANERWTFERKGVDEESGAAWASSTMSKASSGLDLTFRKIDAVLPGSPVHYTSIRVKNNRNEPAEICAAWHNTVGAPFLQAGCRISACAVNWMTAPPGAGFDETARLALGTEFVSLSKAPLAIGGRCDISEVPGVIGYTDFASGAVPLKTGLGWFSIVNTEQKLVYLNFFTGPAAAKDDDIILYFNDLWMQYGGRSFTPWALYDGGSDMSFCVGLENSVSAFANGLEFSRRMKTLLGSPVTTTIPARGEKTLRYGALFAPYENNILDEGITAVEAEEDALVCVKSGTWRYLADPSFVTLKKLEARVSAKENRPGNVA
jgi:hypothetical protein